MLIKESQVDVQTLVDGKETLMSTYLKLLLALMCEFNPW